MRDVIRKMLQAEAEAKRIVQEAETQAEQIRADARKKAQDLAQRAQQETADEVQKILSDAEDQARREKQERIVQIASAIEKEIAMDENFRRESVETVVRAVLGTGGAGD